MSCGLSVPVLAALAACSSGDLAPATVLDPTDISVDTSDEFVFDATTSLVAPADFTDPAAVREISAVQRFFERTPYNKRSFLATYSSNGVTAAGAVLSAALKYGINPIVLLTRLQMVQGLVSADVYPDDSARVEYAFQCGCDGVGSCLPELAGLDRQLECVSARLASYLQQIADSGETTFGGWGPDVTALTLDGVQVTPADRSSAALYQFDPVYGERDKLGGAWVFYRIYLKYSRAFSYSGSIDPSITGKWIGEPCTNVGECSSAIPNARCLQDGPNGYCSGACADDGCVSNPRKAQTYCADLGPNGGGCVAYCNPAAPNCRDGYSCEVVDVFGGIGEQTTACTVPLRCPRTERPALFPFTWAPGSGAMGLAS